MRGRRVAVVLVAFYFAVILFGGLSDHLILFPSKAPINAGGAVPRTVPFRNGQLEIWTAKSQLTHKTARPDVCVLRFYGNADRAERWVAAEAEMWNERAIEIWGLNYPGFGGSTGPARLSSIAPAALCAFDELQRHANENVESPVLSGSSSANSTQPTADTTACPIVVFGTSIGATAALHVAAQRSPAGLILHNPPALRQIILRQFGWWNLWLLAGPIAMQIPAELDSLANAKASRAPAIFLLAERDKVVAPRYHRLIAGAYAGDKRVITLRGAGHNDPIEGAALADFYGALEWLLPRTTAEQSARP
jgi:pimeloyl-ACP methyl ester carboxylesterase